MNNVSTIIEDKNAAKNLWPVVWSCLVLFGSLSIWAGFNAKWKVLAIAWIAFAAMSLAIPFGVRDAQKKSIAHLTISFGLASGAMITSTAIFLMPMAIMHNAVYGGLGIAFGVIAGYAIHILDDSQVWKQVLPVDSVIVELTSHGLLAGLIIGVIYAAMPALGLLLGVAIVSHKAPAGYAAARRLEQKGEPVILLLLPACTIGLTALPMSMIHPAGNAIMIALIFGLAAGVFFHVAVDFLPSRNPGDKQTVDGNAHGLPFSSVKQEIWAISSTITGGLAVFFAWLIIH